MWFTVKLNLPTEHESETGANIFHSEILSYSIISKPTGIIWSATGGFGVKAARHLYAISIMEDCKKRSECRFRSNIVYEKAQRSIRNPLVCPLSNMRRKKRRIVIYTNPKVSPDWILFWGKKGKARNTENLMNLSPESGCCEQKRQHHLFTIH